MSSKSVSISSNVNWTYTKISGTAINKKSPATTVPNQDYNNLTVVSLVTRLLSGSLEPSQFAPPYGQ
jgi:hypothetical protein